MNPIEKLKKLASQIESLQDLSSERQSDFDENIIPQLKKLYF